MTSQSETLSKTNNICHFNILSHLWHCKDPLSERLARLGEEGMDILSTRYRIFFVGIQKGRGMVHWVAWNTDLPVLLSSIKSHHPVDRIWHGRDSTNYIITPIPRFSKVNTFLKSEGSYGVITIELHFH